MIMKPTHRGIDAVIYIDEIPLGGQSNARLNRSMTPINITNKIKGEWEESISGLKQWSLTCSGMYIKDELAFKLLEEAFEKGTKVQVKLTDNNKHYTGFAFITSFPISAKYNDTFTYTINLKGTGPLK